MRNVSFAFRKPSLPDRRNGSSVGQTGTGHPSVWGDCQCSCWRWFICHLCHSGPYPGNKKQMLHYCNLYNVSKLKSNNHSKWSLIVVQCIYVTTIIFIFHLILNICYNYFSLSTCTVHPTSTNQQCYSCKSYHHDHSHGHPG